MKVVPPTVDGIAEAADAILRGEVVAYPTETVYGLAVDPHNSDAVRRLFATKGRPADAPVLVLIGRVEELDQLVASVSARAQALIDAFWPGPLSLTLPSAETFAPELTGGHEKVCVRLAAHEVAKALCDAVGGPITSTSANATGQPAAMSIEELALDGVSIAIDGGTLSSSPPSTVYDPDDDILIRPGAIDLEAIQGA